MFSLGYREKRHFAVQIFLEDLSKKGKLESIYAEIFSAAMESREGADYRYQYSENISEAILDDAKKFLERIRSLL